MKIELTVEEINEAIALYLRENKLSGYHSHEITDIKVQDNFADMCNVTASAIVESKKQPSVVPAASPQTY